jgi:predicted phosphodiesterase
MKLQIFSDVHCEYLDNIKFVRHINVKADILVLAGDIGQPSLPIYKDFLLAMSKMFKKIFIIAGNHENYNSTIEETNKQISSIVKLTNITFLNNSYEDYQGYRFIGTTLWSNIKDKRYLTNDLHLINNFSLEKYNKLHEESVEFIKNMIKTSDKPIVCITHYLPSMTLTDRRYNRLYDQCYASDLDYLIRDPIKVWIHGHTHRRQQSFINGITVLCNPIGYKGENNNVSYHETIELP